MGNITALIPFVGILFSSVGALAIWAYSRLRPAETFMDEMIKLGLSYSSIMLLSIGMPCMLFGTMRLIGSWITLPKKICEAIQQETGTAGLIGGMGLIGCAGISRSPLFQHLDSFFYLTLAFCFILLIGICLGFTSHAMHTEVADPEVPQQVVTAVPLKRTLLIGAVAGFLGLCGWAVMLRLQPAENIWEEAMQMYCINLPATTLLCYSLMQIVLGTIRLIGGWLPIKGKTAFTIEMKSMFVMAVSAISIIVVASKGSNILYAIGMQNEGLVELTLSITMSIFCLSVITMVAMRGSQAVETNT